MSQSNGRAATLNPEVIDQQPPWDLDTEHGNDITTGESTAPPENGNPPKGILPHHWRELRSGGLSAETVLEAGIHSETNHNRIALAINRNRWPRKYGPALMSPYLDVNDDLDREENQ